MVRLVGIAEYSRNTAGVRAPALTGPFCVHRRAALFSSYTNRNRTPQSVTTDSSSDTSRS
jgi:hypothetical protein